MKALALLAAATAVLSAPAASEARDKRLIIVGGSNCAPRYTSHSNCYTTYSRPSYSYYRPYVSTRSNCYTSYPSYRSYSYPSYRSYSYVPSVSFSYVSTPRTYYRSAPAYDYNDGDALEVDVQRELRRRGYYDGALDGDIGPSSRSAIRAFQYDRALSPTGRIDSALLRALGL